MYDKEWIGDAPEGSTLYWIIVYPGGDLTRLAVAEMCDALDYEENDYRIASRKRFRVESDAVTYCKQLAKDNDLKCDLDSTSEIGILLD